MMVPSVADHEVAPAEVNCCVLPTVTVVAVGEIVCVAAGTRVTAAEPEPDGPVAAMVTLVLEGRLAGAAYMPVELIVPAVADHDVAPAAVNCCFLPTAIVAFAGETDTVAVVAVPANGTAKTGPNRVLLFFTERVAIPVFC